MKRLFLTILALTLFSTAAFAHNGMVHVMGTVTATTDKSISVKGNIRQDADCYAHTDYKILEGR